MTTINLRDYYPFYTSDCFIDVPDEVAALLLAHARYEAARCYISSTKNDRSRVITPAPYVMELLRDVRRRQNEMRLKAGRVWDNKWNLGPK